MRIDEYYDVGGHSPRDTYSQKSLIERVFHILCFPLPSSKV